MKSLAEATTAWQNYIDCKSLAGLKDLLWTSEVSPTFILDLRSPCWKAFLVFQNLETESWPRLLQDARLAYGSVRAHFLRLLENPSELGVSGADPLSDDEQSDWHALRADETLREEIFRDVERCLPDRPYFRQPRVQQQLLDILFVWCKLNPDVGYRQGMHELLAPVLWVVDDDSQDSEGGHLTDLLDAKYIEHDSFTIFSSLMQTAKSFYEPASKSEEGEDADSPMVTRAKHIFYNLLPVVDPELAAHLQDIEILPQIFLMRWVRVLFGREFPFLEVLQIWDLLFSSSPSLDLVDYVCLAMLLRVRWDLLKADTNEAFSLLLRYPSLPEPQKPTSLVRDALKLHDSLTAETGQAIVLKRTGRKPSRAPFATPAHLSKRRPSPAHLTVPSPASLEAILQDAARGVMSRSERWGLNQALRDVLGEVRRNVKTVQSTGGSTSPARPSGEPSRSAKSRSVSHSTIAANALRRINSLEARNKTLSRMLEDATSEILQVFEELEENQATKDQAEKLRGAASKVETINTFLKDLTLPLPGENSVPEGSSAHSPAPDDVPIAPTGDKDKDTPTVPEVPVAPARVKSPGGPKPQLGPLTAHEREKPKLSSSAAVRKPTSGSSSPLVKPRPHISESPLSWMLAGNEDRDQIAKPAFLKTATLSQRHSRHTSTGSEARSGKGYLFGDMNDDDTADRQTRDARTRSATRKGTMEDISLEDVRGTEAKRGRTQPRTDDSDQPAGP